VAPCGFALGRRYQRLPPPPSRGVVRPPKQCYVPYRAGYRSYGATGVTGLPGLRMATSRAQLGRTAALAVRSLGFARAPLRTASRFAVGSFAPSARGFLAGRLLIVVASGGATGVTGLPKNRRAERGGARLRPGSARSGGWLASGAAPKAGSWPRRRSAPPCAARLRAPLSAAVRPCPLAPSLRAARLSAAVRPRPRSLAPPAPLPRRFRNVCASVLRFFA